MVKNTGSAEGAVPRHRCNEKSLTDTEGERVRARVRQTHGMQRKQLTRVEAGRERVKESESKRG